MSIWNYIWGSAKEPEISNTNDVELTNIPPVNDIKKMLHEHLVKKRENMKLVSMLCTPSPTNLANHVAEKATIMKVLHLFNVEYQVPTKSVAVANHDLRLMTPIDFAPINFSTVKYTPCANTDNDYDEELIEHPVRNHNNKNKNRRRNYKKWFQRTHTVQERIEQSKLAERNQQTKKKNWADRIIDQQ